MGNMSCSSQRAMKYEGEDVEGHREHIDMYYSCHFGKVVDEEDMSKNPQSPDIPVLQQGILDLLSSYASTPILQI